MYMQLMEYHLPL
ncbi:Protein of unknown function [Bacillus mycoides]|uniref:Uncharacterized protein n=1 Tax=Bacillus mycoides TaxID=1405 RepID=A0A1G4EDM5_BACMY|nr:Protein of unknown function [Bacillus mycoides]